jgi:hypothetical protein
LTSSFLMTSPFLKPISHQATISMVEVGRY